MLKKYWNADQYSVRWIPLGIILLGIIIVAGVFDPLPIYAGLSMMLMFFPMIGGTMKTFDLGSKKKHDIVKGFLACWVVFITLFFTYEAEVAYKENTGEYLWVFIAFPIAFFAAGMMIFTPYNKEVEDEDSE